MTDGLFWDNRQESYLLSGLKPHTLWILISIKFNVLNLPKCIATIRALLLKVGAKQPPQSWEKSSLTTFQFKQRTTFTSCRKEAHDQKPVKTSKTFPFHKGIFYTNVRNIMVLQWILFDIRVQNHMQIVKRLQKYKSFWRVFRQY